MLKSGLCAIHGRNADLTDTQVNFGKYLFLRDCIDMLDGEWLTFFPKHSFCSLKQIFLQAFHVQFQFIYDLKNLNCSALVRPFQGARLLTLFGSMDPLKHDQC